MMYDYYNKNIGKDLIYQNRLKIASKLGIELTTVSAKLYSYLMKAELGIILIG